MKKLNDEIKQINLKNDEPIVNTFLTSCFLFYYGKIEINQPNSKKENLHLTSHFLNTTKYNKVIIIDYANIIYTLHDKYNNKRIVSEKFYRFLLNNLRENNKIIIITKPVIIHGKIYNIEKIIAIGNKLAKKEDRITDDFFEKEQICIYLLNFFTKISSSIDDLLQYFCLFVLFVYYKKTATKILKNSKEQINKSRLTLLTNDKQLFDKNLFGKTIDEKKHRIEYLKDLQFKKLILQKNKCVYVKNIVEELLIKNFLHDYMTEDINNTDLLECNLSVLVELLLKKKSIYGFFKNEQTKKYNSNFIRSNITRSKIKHFDYNSMNSLQKKRNNTFKKCKKNVVLNKNLDLKRNYYLYAFIKYMQIYMLTINNKENKYGDFYGNYSKDYIIELFD